MNKRLLFQIGGLVLLVVVAALLWPKLNQPAPTPAVTVTDFSSCQEAGGLVTDGEPVTCTYQGNKYSEETTLVPDVILDSPQYGDLVKSPMSVVGKARGTWFFEASMPVTLKDENGKVLFQGPIQAAGDWMTTDYVNFALAIPFDPGDAQYGVLIISKDNPSGDPARDASYAVPLRFK